MFKSISKNKNFLDIIFYDDCIQYYIFPLNNKNPINGIVKNASIEMKKIDIKNGLFFDNIDLSKYI